MSKSILLFFIFFLAIRVNTSAQISAEIYSGYSVSLNPDETFGIPGYYGNTGHYKPSKVPNGRGINLGMKLEYRFNKDLSVLINYKTQVATMHSIDNDISRYTESEGINYLIMGYFGQHSLENKTNYFSAMVRFYHELNTKTEIAFNIGPVIAFSEQHHYRYNNYYNKFSDEYNSFELNQIYKSDSNFGVNASIDIIYSLGSDFYLVGSLSLINISFNYSEAELLDRKIDGETSMPDPEYMDSYTEIDLRQDFSQLGLNIGVKYSFN